MVKCWHTFQPEAWETKKNNKKISYIFLRKLSPKTYLHFRVKPDFTYYSNSSYHLKHFLLFFKKSSAIFSQKTKSEKQKNLPWKNFLYFLKQLCSKNFLYHGMKPDLTYYDNSLLPLKNFLYFLAKKKKASPLSRPKPEKQKKNKKKKPQKQN